MLLFFVQLAGAVALLLWSVRMIRTGMERAFASRIRMVVRRSTDRRATAAVAGAGAAILFQSSTAVAMLAAAFAAAKTLPPAAGLALLLGADFGSAVVTQILLTPIEAVVPFLLLAGVALFFKGRGRAWRQTGRILVGLALVLVSLGMIRASTAPLTDSPLVTMIVAYFERDLVSAFATGAVLAWIMHSSVAAVLMYVTFVSVGLLPAGAAVALVLGANLGGAFIPVLLTLSAARPARLIVSANLLLRGGLAILALAALVALAPDLSRLGAAPERQVINLHLLFNLAVAILALPFVPAAIRVVDAILPSSSGVREAQISALDGSAMEDPERALACASRETLHMGERLLAMLAPALDLYREWSDDAAGVISKCEDDIDRMHFETKLYIAQLQKRDLDESQSRRAMALVTIANNLEEAGDRISTNLVDMARRMRSDGLAFSDDGWRDLTDFHDQVVANTQLALNVMMTADPDSARRLVEEKEQIRAAEQRLQARHLDRLKTGKPASIETSNIHQETLRALKQINAAVCYVAYPIAEEAGDLLSTRLSRARA